jgi:hypothetical protein
MFGAAENRPYSSMFAPTLPWSHYWLPYRLWRCRANLISPPHVYADGEAWGTKVTTVLPMPKGNNEHSFDKFFVVIADGMPVQMPVGEAVPGNPAYKVIKLRLTSRAKGSTWQQAGPFCVYLRVERFGQAVPRQGAGNRIE